MKQHNHKDELITLMRRVEELESSDEKWKHAQAGNVMFQQFVVTSKEGLGWADMNGAIRYLNPALTRMLELERPDTKYGEPVAQFYDAETQRRLAEEIFPTVLEKGTWTGEFVLHSVKGKSIPTRNSLFLLRDSEGNPLCFGNVVTDLTELRRVEEELRKHRDELESLVKDRTQQLEKANLELQQNIAVRKKEERERLRLERKVHETQKLESLGILAGGIAHDFNNLLMGVLGNADLALLDLEEKSAPRSRVLDIKTTAKRLSELTNQMLAYSGKGKFFVEPINLSQMVTDTASLLTLSISKKVTLQYDLMSDIPMIKGDASQLRQLLMNLITNASEAIEEGEGSVVLVTGVVSIGTDNRVRDLPSGNYVFLQVSDTGCGMRTETIDKMFDPFFTTKSTGRGLGLSAVKGIVRGHAGDITIKSEPGRGTIISVYFPQADNVETAPQKATEDVATYMDTGTILVVDDEEIVRIVAQTILESAGYDVVVASDGPQALEILRDQNKDFGAVLLDFTMPKMNGLETFREIRVLRPTIPVILSSGYSQNDAINEFNCQDFSDFIQKPYGTNLLIQKMNAIFERSHK